MIWVWIFAVPLAGAVAAGLTWLLRRRSALVPLAPPAPPAPEPVTDPLHPDWRPSGEVVEPLYADQMPAPAAWPMVMPHNGSPTEGER